MSLDSITLLRDRVKHEYKSLFAIKDSASNLELYPIFNTLPPKKDYPDYYIIIKNPVSLNTLKKRIPHYVNVNEFLLDLAQIPWNAKTYNAKDSTIYRYANILEDYLKKVTLPHLQKFYPDTKYPNLGLLPDEKPYGIANNPIVNILNEVPDKIITVKPTPPQEIKKDIPTIITQQANNREPPTIFNTAQPYPQQMAIKQSPLPQLPVQPIQQQQQKEITPFSRTVSNTPLPSISSAHSYNNNKMTLNTSKKTHVRRGRPPIIDLPYIQRMKNVLKVLKRENDPSTNESLLSRFEKLPDRNKYPEFYTIITNSVVVDDIWRKIKTRKYKNFNDFQIDFSTLIESYKIYYNTIRDLKGLNLLVYMEKTFHMSVEFELSKPDKDFIPEGEFRYPIDEIAMDNKTYFIGDWVFLNNPNDPNKPIVGQIFKLWSTPDGKKWLNACWYFRPEQTVHRVDRLFYKNEVMKTGQYRDHPIEDIRGKCYVIHFTRYQRGDPDFVVEGPLFICEFRYNENDKVFNKIRTWKACLPEEIRDLDEQTIPINGRKFFKYPSPIKHLLPPNATENDAMPEAQPGLPNAPPLVGAVYIRPKLERDDLGEYASSDECPRYIIRPGDPQEEGDVDYINGTIVTKGLTQGLSLSKSSNAMSSMSATKMAFNAINMKHAKALSNAHKIKHLSKAQLLQLSENGTNINGLAHTVGADGLDFANSNYNSINRAQYSNDNLRLANNLNSRLGLNTMTSGSHSLMVTKFQQKNQPNKSINSLIQNLQMKNTMAHVMVDAPGSYTLPVSIPQFDSNIQVIDHGNLSRRYSKQELTMRKTQSSINETVWFRGTGITTTERIINLGDSHFEIPLNWKPEIEIGELEEKKELRTIEYNEVEEMVVTVNNVMNNTREENIVSTMPLVGPDGKMGLQTITTTGESDNESDEDEDMDERGPKDSSEIVLGPFIYGLRPSSKFMAYKLNIAKQTTSI